LIPIGSLDGGNLLKSIIWHFSGSKNKGRNFLNKVNLLLSFFVLFFWIVCLFRFNFYFGFILSFMGLFGVNSSKEIIIFEEKNTTYRAKARYFELFPIRGLKFLMPREVFILNKNLDAISALVILEDYCKMKFTLNQNIDFKTWLK